MYWSSVFRTCLWWLFTSLSFPQHLCWWLQLLTDDGCNRLMSSKKETMFCGHWPQNVISCLWEVWALLIKQLGWAAQIDCQDAVRLTIVKREVESCYGTFFQGDIWNSWNWTYQTLNIKEPVFLPFLIGNGWVSDFLGTLILKTSWTTGNLACPILIVTLTLKLTDAKQWRKAPNLLCEPLSLCIYSSIHPHTWGIWVHAYVLRYSLGIY